MLADEPIHRAYAGITLPNDASVALHRRFGFRDIGVYDEVGFKLGQYWSVLWLEKRMAFAGQPTTIGAHGRLPAQSTLAVRARAAGGQRPELRPDLPLR